MESRLTTQADKTVRVVDGKATQEEGVLVTARSSQTAEQETTLRLI